MIRWFYKINKKINLSPRRVRDFYSNLIAGIVAGGVVGWTLTMVQTCSDVKYNIPNLLQILIFIFISVFLYLIGKSNLSKITKNIEELKNYDSNIQTGFFASLFVTILLVFQNVWIRLLIIFPPTLIFIVIVYLIAGRKKR